MQETGSFINEVTFTGSVTDTSTGLQYMNARFYDPQTARFISQDTYTGSAYDPWTQHLYAYCGNNPTNFIDPTGHSWELALHEMNKAGEKGKEWAKKCAPVVAPDNDNASSEEEEVMLYSELDGYLLSCGYSKSEYTEEGLLPPSLHEVIEDSTMDIVTDKMFEQYKMLRPEFSTQVDVANYFLTIIDVAEAYNKASKLWMMREHGGTKLTFYSTSVLQTDIVTDDTTGLYGMGTVTTSTRRIVTAVTDDNGIVVYLSAVGQCVVGTTGLVDIKAGAHSWDFVEDVINLNLY